MMKKTIRLSIVLACLMLLVAFSQLVYARYVSTEPWPMYRHDLARTGTITTTAPDSNQTLLWSHGRSTTKSHNRCKALGIPNRRITFNRKQPRYLQRKSVFRHECRLHVFSECDHRPLHLTLHCPGRHQNSTHNH